ncbi:MAG: immunoglobulin domain-containing protein [Opitutaceae bacterium]|nr:immunoglobulin domain-containing protein [Opitutaceae bacterium]
MHASALRSLRNAIFLAALGACAPALTSAAEVSLVSGQVATLGVTVDGTAPFSYQWYKDGAAVAGANGATFVVDASLANRAGTYHVVVANNGGSTTSDSATISVQPLVTPPVITTQPVSQTVTAGGGVTFSAAASGVPAPTYQWRKDGVDLAGATAASYSIPGTTTADAGVYSVVATNTGGAVTSVGATLTVNPAAVAPVITTQPVSRTVTSGSAVSFSVAATGSPAPTYQWRRNGAVISGATGATYELANVSAGQAGTYSVVVANAAGTVTSVDATLTVNTVPAFTTQPASRTVNAGTAVTFTAAASGSPAPTYQWRKNGVNLAGATAASYTIASAAGADAGTYTVVASNSAGSATSAGATLTVNVTVAAPVITAQPVSQTVTKGGPLTLGVAASSTVAVSYQWRRNGTNISGATGVTYSVGSVSTSHAGTYTVVVTNAGGSVTSAGAVLTVRSSTYPIVLQTDFNNDGRADLVWQNTLTGDASVWLMNGTKRSSSKALGRITADWLLAGAGDFNNDGKGDLLWQNLVTGLAQVWLMNGTTLSTNVSVGNPGTDWVAGGTGDFNGDGRSDILWQNRLTGEVSLWLMNGTSRTAAVAVGTVVPDWQIVGTGDFNKDGQSDILWQHDVTGECRIWLMAAATLGSEVALGSAPAGWELGGAADFNKDGRSDIVWQHPATGERAAWLMSSPNSGTTATLNSLAAEWVLAN